MPAGFEHFGIGHRCGDRRGSDDADTGNGLQPLADFARAVTGLYRAFDGANFLLQLADLPKKNLGTSLGHVWQETRWRGVYQLGELLDLRYPLRDNQAEFRHLAAQGVDQHGALPHQQISRPMQHQDRLLVSAFNGNEAHRRTGYRLADRLGVHRIVFAALYIRLHIGCGHQTNLVPECCQLPPPVIRVNGGAKAGHRGGVKAGQSGRDGGRSRRALFDSAVASERPSGFGVVVAGQAVSG